MTGGPSPCMGALVSPEAALRDPMLARVLSTQLGHGGTIGKLFVWCSDVDEYKARIDPSMRATDLAVAACTSLPAPQRAAWVDFFAAWGKFKASSCLVFGAGPAYDEADEWRVQLGEWQALLSKSCALSSPSVSTEPEGALFSSALKWLAVAGIAGAVVYGVHAVLK